MSPAHEHVVEVRPEPRVAGDVAPLVELDTELLEQSFALRPDESHREQHELARELEVGALDLLERHAAVDELLLDLVGPQRAHVAGVVAEEALGVHRVHALAALLVGRRDAVDHRIRRPRHRVGAGVGRAGQDLELVDRRGALADARCRDSRRRCRRRR